MTPEMFRKLAALGLSHEQMAGVLEIFEADAEVRKEKARARVQKWRDKQKETQRNVTEHHVTLQTGSRAGVARGDDNLLPEEISGKKEEKKTRAASPRGVSDLDAFRAELSSILDDERIEALVAVRRKKGATITANTGRLLVAAIQRCARPPAEVADEMALRNWTSVKPEWLDPPQQRANGPPAKPRTIGEMFTEDARRMGLINDETTSDFQGCVDQGDRRGQGGSPGIARRFAVSGDWLGKA